MNRRQRRTAWSLALQFMVSGLFGPHLGPTLLGLGYSSAATGLMVASLSLCTIVAPFAAGFLTQRRGSARDVVRLCSLLAFACAPLLYPLRHAPLLPAVLLLLALARAPLAAVLDAISMEVADNAAGTYARLRLCASVGWMLAASASGWWMARGGVENFCLGMMVLTGVGLAATTLLPVATALPAVVPGAPATEALWGYLHRPFWLWLGAATLHTCATAPYHFGFTLYLTEQRLPSELTGLIWSLGVVAEIVAFVACRPLFRRFSPVQITTLALGANGLRWLLLAWAPSPAVVILSQLLHGPGFALFHTASMQVLARQAPQRLQTTLQGLYATLVNGVAMAVGTIGAGLLHEHYSFQQIFAWVLPCQLLALALLLLSNGPRSAAAPQRLQPAAA